MKIHVNDKDYELIFAHHLKGAEPGTQATQVRLESRGCPGMVLDEAYALCSASDQYSKAIGRKVALTRLLKRGWTRAQRKTLWEQYWKGVGKDYHNEK